MDLVGQPSTGQYRVIYIPYFSSAEGYSVQVAIGAVTNDGLYWRKAWGSTWQPWQPTPPKEYDLPLAAGITATSVPQKYFKTQEGLVQVDFNINANAQIVQGTEKIVATLPAGYRPARVTYAIVITHYAGIDGIGLLRVNTNGTVSCSSNANSWQHFYGQISFRAA